MVERSGAFLDEAICGLMASVPQSSLASRFTPGALTKPVRVFIRDVRPVRHPLLEMPDPRRLAPRDRDRQHVAVGGQEFDDIAAIVLRAVDHDPVLAGHHPSNHNNSSPTVPPAMAAR